jgi:hypothetical protein
MDIIGAAQTETDAPKKAAVSTPPPATKPAPKKK